MLQRLTGAFTALTLCLTLAGALLAPRTFAQDTPKEAIPKSDAANPRVEMVIEMPEKKTGTILIELLPKDAPKTVAHFLSLVGKKFYDGILFHRYVEGFVTQGGDPKSKGVDGAKLRNLTGEEVGQQYQLGMGGSGATVPLEVSAAHDRGTVGLARSQAPDSGDSQFFFNLKPNHFLDKDYCVFGKVLKGLDIMDNLRQGDKIVSVRVVKAEPKK